MYPDDLRYTKDHEWIRPQGDRGVVGITHHAQAQLGDVVFVELPALGRKLEAGEAFGTVESVKAVSELFSPVSGEVLEVNAALAKTPEAVNSDPYGQGWMIVIRPADPKELDALLDSTGYRKLIGA
jgi:glycine cleavage system H protein